MEETVGKKEISFPVMIGIIAVVVLLAAFFLYRAMTGGTVGQGQAGSIQASPPMGDSAKQQMQQMYKK